MWLLQVLYSFIYNSLLEFVFYVLVDIVARTPLKEARNQAEKRTIWLYESLVLAAVSLLVYICDHTPYILLLLTSLTLAYTLFCGRVDFSYWWTNVNTRWEEYQQHQESMLMMQQQEQQQKQMAAAMQMSTQQGKQSSIQQRLYQFSPFAQQSQQQPKTFSSIIDSENDINTGSAWLRGARLRLRNPLLGENKQPDTYYQQIPKVSDSVGAYVSQPTHVGVPNAATSLYDTRSNHNNLKRRPLRPVQTDSINSLHTNKTSTLRSCFMSAIGLFKNQRNKPAGLRNEGQNLCFLNCVVQCLARSPYLFEKLEREIIEDFECSVAESALFTSVLEICSNCLQKSGFSENVIEPDAFRRAVSLLNATLVAPPTERQGQQDAAEFFMWLIGILHTMLNKKKKDSKTSRKTESPTLKMLQFIYGDLDPARLKDLKDACRREISQAHGLDNNSYAEPIQRLSDLEWLTHKQHNNSFVDDMFSGQLVEAYHCLTSNHISVTTQTFSILPVPIVAPRDVSGLVLLEDCFTKFCNIEYLIGQDHQGMRCAPCHKSGGVQQFVRSSTPSSVSVHSYVNKRISVNPRGSTDSAVHSPLRTQTVVSPIVGERGFNNDSGFHDNAFKTSTPISDQGYVSNTYPTFRLCDAQRRCLLRQLPDCLVIQMLRFSFNPFSHQSRKLTTPVSIPVKGLDLTHIVYDNVTQREDLTAVHDSYKYDLYAVCIHLGAESTNCGHYVCYCLNENGTWFKFDDELVTEVNMEFEVTTREIRENAYLLFYKRSSNEIEDKSA
ncbi:hypothetical protein CHS0354_023569 [Potamilus streckersoni]|uniref:ubiquitinyl hydrolase 1 n=1 Tax=Potamilus streckersoni TaxID=2493646 RepID=A0AAE0VS74_9BIVA|nr:hypothetical protein CHS0354_023569 [Potamilus streckersoni]